MNEKHQVRNPHKLTMFAKLRTKCCTSFKRSARWLAVKGLLGRRRQAKTSFPHRDWKSETAWQRGRKFTSLSLAFFPLPPPSFLPWLPPPPPAFSFLSFLGLFLPFFSRPEPDSFQTLQASLFRPKRPTQLLTTTVRDRKTVENHLTKTTWTICSGCATYFSQSTASLLVAVSTISPSLLSLSKA